MKPIVEVCSNSVQSAINAELAGANRIELCENLMLGGTTPSIGCIKTTRQKVKIPINVLVRPRYGDFLYTELEFEQIKADIQVIKSLGVQGIVCGILHPDGTVDIDRTRQLAELAHPLTFTFHRAFDFTPNAHNALKDVIQTGATHILTSGHQNHAVNAIAQLKQLVNDSRKHIKIIVGSGVNQNTICSLKDTCAEEFHMSGITLTHSDMKYRPTNLSLNDKMPNDYSIQISSAESIMAVIGLL